MSRVTEMKHLWIGGLALLMMVASTKVRGALWMDLGSLQFHHAVLAGGPSAAERTQRALDFASRAGVLNPASARPLVLAATVHLGEGDAQTAIALLERAAALEPSNVGVRFQLADAYRGVGAKDLALPHWRTARAMPMLLQQGVEAGKSGRLSEAREYFKIATLVDPSAYEPWILLGHASVSLGRLEDAELAYTQAVERQPGRSAAYEELATLLSGPLGRPEQAEAVIAEALARVQAPGPGLFLLRSQLAVDQSDYAAAEQAAQQAIAIAPRQGRALAWLGELYYRQERYPEALAQYLRTEAEASDPVWRWRSYRRIGQTHAAQQNWDAAVEAYRMALTISQAQGSTGQVLSQNHLALGEALRQSGEIELARAAFNQALADDPTNERAARWLAAIRRP